MKSKLLFIMFLTILFTGCVSSKDFKENNLNITFQDNVIDENFWYSDIINKAQELFLTSNINPIHYKEEITVGQLVNYLNKLKENEFYKKTINGKKLDSNESKNKKLLTKEELSKYLVDFFDIPKTDEVFYSNSDNVYANSLFNELILNTYMQNSQIIFKSEETVTHIEALSLIERCFEYKQNPQKYKEKYQYIQRTKIKLPILMYHDVEKDIDDYGEYIVSPDKFESDILLLIENGYNSVGLEEVSAYIDGYYELPCNPIIITIDDGYKGTFKYVLPTAEKYGFSIVVNVIGEWVNSEFTIEDMQKAFKTGLFEFQNHTYGMHKLGPDRTSFYTEKQSTESRFDYEIRVFNDLIKNNDFIFSITGVKPTTFAFPYGVVNDTLEKQLKKAKIEITMCSKSGINNLDDGLLKLKRINISQEKSSIKAITEHINN